MIGRTIGGAIAAVKWSYFTAGVVQRYRVTHDKATGTWTAAGMLVAVDAFKITQRPIWLVAPFKGGAWRWEILTLTRHDGGTFTAHLGPISTENPHGIARPTAGY